MVLFNLKCSQTLAFACNTCKNYMNASLYVLAKYLPLLPLLACSDSRCIVLNSRLTKLGNIGEACTYYECLWKQTFSFWWRFLKLTQVKILCEVESNLHTWRHVGYSYYYPQSTFRACQTWLRLVRYNKGSVALNLLQSVRGSHVSSKYMLN